MSKATRQLAKIRVSRFLRGTFNSLKERFNRDTSGSPDNIFGDGITPDKQDKEPKYKSTGVIFTAGVAMGVSQVAAASARYRVKLTPKSTVIAGAAVGVVTAATWYNYVDAADDDVSEEDIIMMFDMVENTGLGSMSDDPDRAKAVDILHAMVTGEVSESTAPKAKSRFDSDEDEEEEDEIDKVDKNDPYNRDSGFSDVTRDDGIGSDLHTHKRKSHLPDIDNEDTIENKQGFDGFLDI